MINILKKHKTKGLKISLPYVKPSLDIIQIDKINQLIFPLQDHKSNFYTATVNKNDTVSKGQIIAICKANPNLKILSSVNGIVENIETAYAPLPQQKCKSIIIKPSEKIYNYNDVFYSKDFNLNQFSSSELLEYIEQANIQGLGGALFNTALKIKHKKIKNIILNAVECEPILNCDEAILHNYLAEVCIGGLALKKITQAEKVTIVIKKTSKEIIKHINFFVKNNEEFKDIELKTTEDKYPSGAEKIIINNLFGKNLKAKDIPANHGFLTVNVMTAFCIFRAIAAQQAQLERVLSIFGKNLVNAYNILCPIGTTVQDILNFLNFTKDDIQSIKIGGLMMGQALAQDTDLNKTAILKSSNCIAINLNENHPAIECTNCGKCTSACPVNLVPHKMHKFASEDNFDNIFLRNIDECIECNLCNYVCPSHIKLVEMFKYAKQEKKSIQLEQERAKYISKLTNDKIARNKKAKEQQELAKKLRLQRRKKLNNDN